MCLRRAPHAADIVSVRGEGTRRTIKLAKTGKREQAYLSKRCSFLANPHASLNICNSVDSVSQKSFESDLTRARRRVEEETSTWKRVARGGEWVEEATVGEEVRWRGWQRGAHASVERVPEKQACSTGARVKASGTRLQAHADAEYMLLLRFPGLSNPRPVALARGRVVC